ncbi:hypothetical protein [Paeniglutamicibacter psychrophenolicus]|uniref:hypothetical protein n=1 Tax=Paeniglutamicibacter psychrophenolicus TaxID=257454 RepID=UPI00277FC806|nr:hypothetical protein [Paeniglutamicibacter psychrophenolicus]MDQ0092503.1 hypothetical protein [Paeniglutamicibacter psychrophenolicus]
MVVSTQYEADVVAILAKRHDNGADCWATLDGRIAKGSPFTTLDCAVMLCDLGVDPTDSVLKQTSDVIFDALREDGRFQLAPGGAIYPCHTVNAARALSYLGFAGDDRLEKTFDHLLAIEHNDGGWQCRKFSYGRGPETRASNPGPTLAALDIFRLAGRHDRSPSIDSAVEFLLDHWTTRTPLGPCHFGIGTLFMQVTYPFASYNLFFYVYVLSFFERARGDRRFMEALLALESTMAAGRIVVQRPHPKLSTFAFCRAGKASDLATLRFDEIRRNLD